MAAENISYIKERIGLGFVHGIGPLTNKPRPVSCDDCIAEDGRIRFNFLLDELCSKLDQLLDYDAGNRVEARIVIEQFVDVVQSESLMIRFPKDMRKYVLKLMSKFLKMNG